jgi:hypothetical protein
MGTYAMDCSRHLFEFYNETEKNTEVPADFMRGKANTYVIRYSLQGKLRTELISNTLLVTLTTRFFIQIRGITTA